MPHYPALQEFITEKAPSFERLRVTYTNGAPPVIMLHDSAGRTVEEVSIASWKVDQMQEFLAEKLVVSK